MADFNSLDEEVDDKRSHIDNASSEICITEKVINQL